MLKTVEQDAEYSSYLFPSLPSVERPVSERTRGKLPSVRLFMTSLDTAPA